MAKIQEETIYQDKVIEDVLKVICKDCGGQVCIINRKYYKDLDCEYYRTKWTEAMNEIVRLKMILKHNGINTNE